MKENLNLTEDFSKIKEGDLSAIIDFCELHSDYLFSDSAIDISEIEHIYIDFLVSLYQKSRYSKVLEVIDRFEKTDSIIAFRVIDREFDEDVRYYKFASLFHKKQYKNSKKGFAELVKDFPENEDYQEWLIDSKKKISNRIFGLIMYYSGGFLFLVTAFRLYLNIPLLGIINRIAEGLFVLSIALFLIDLKRKRK